MGILRGELFPSILKSRVKLLHLQLSFSFFDTYFIKKIFTLFASLPEHGENIQITSQDPINIHYSNTSPSLVTAILVTPISLRSGWTPLNLSLTVQYLITLSREVPMSIVSYLAPSRDRSNAYFI